MSHTRGSVMKDVNTLLYAALQGCLSSNTVNSFSADKQLSRPVNVPTTAMVV
jgi:hypothetical protein